MCVVMVGASARVGSDADARADMGANMGMAALVGSKVGMSTAAGAVGTSAEGESAASVEISHNAR
jgi:hypothetical protein